MKWIFLLTVIVGIARSQEVVPTDGMVIKSNTTFRAGTYKLPNGITIGAQGILLDMVSSCDADRGQNGAVLVGNSFQNYGVTIQNQKGVTVINGVLKNYFYGVFVEFSDGIEISGCDLSDNYVDPNSLGKNPPWYSDGMSLLTGSRLNINVGPDLSTSYFAF